MLHQRTNAMLSYRLTGIPMTALTKCSANGLLELSAVADSQLMHRLAQQLLVCLDTQLLHMLSYYTAWSSAIAHAQLLHSLVPWQWHPLSYCTA